MPQQTPTLPCIGKAWREAPSEFFSGRGKCACRKTTTAQIGVSYPPASDLSQPQGGEPWSRRERDTIIECKALSRPALCRGDLASLCCIKLRSHDTGGLGRLGHRKDAAPCPFRERLHGSFCINGPLLDERDGMRCAVRKKSESQRGCLPNEQHKEFRAQENETGVCKKIKDVPPEDPHSQTPQRTRRGNAS